MHIFSVSCIFLYIVCNDSLSHVPGTSGDEGASGAEAMEVEGAVGGGEGAPLAIEVTKEASGEDSQDEAKSIKCDE